MLEPYAMPETIHTHSHPLFPGNVQALSPPGPQVPSLNTASSSSTSHSSSSSSGLSTSATPPEPTQQDKRKRTQTLAACRPCRKRKTKCDGGRPECKTCYDKAIDCVYSVEEGKTQQQASREQLKSYKTIITMLRRASPAEASVIVRYLKEYDDVNDVVRSIRAGPLMLGRSTMSGA